MSERCMNEPVLSCYGQGLLSPAALTRPVISEAVDLGVGCTRDRASRGTSLADPVSGGTVGGHRALRRIGIEATVTDFWRWALSDLRDNTTRGILTEFLVAKAVGGQRAMRIGWDNFDAQTPDGTTIEVKCSAFLQSWVQKRYSDLVFGRLSAREFDATCNEYSVDVRVRADVFVFAVQTQREPASYDVLDISHWEFWVASASTIRERAGKTVGISWVRQYATGPLSHGDLADAIPAAAQKL